MNKIYIYLFKEETIVGKVARKLLKYPYTHIAFTLNHEDFITFSRRRHYDPFNSGFMIEERAHYTFGDNKEIEARYYVVEANDKQLRDINDYMMSVSNDCFNLYGMLLSPLGGIEIDGANNCMTFVAHVLELANIELIKKPYYKNSIEDIEKALIHNKCLKEDVIFRKEKEDDNYMKKVSLITKAKSFIKLNKKLIKGLINKRSKM